MQGTAGRWCGPISGLETRRNRAKQPRATVESGTSMLSVAALVPTSVPSPGWRHPGQCPLQTGRLVASRSAAAVGRRPDGSLRPYATPLHPVTLLLDPAPDCALWRCTPGHEGFMRPQEVALMADPHQGDGWLTIRSAADAFGVSTDTVRRAIRGGRLPRAYQRASDSAWLVTMADLLQAGYTPAERSTLPMHAGDSPTPCLGCADLVTEVASLRSDNARLRELSLQLLDRIAERVSPSEGGRA